MNTTKPLTGKYAKLRDDLKAALEVGKAAQTGEDGGTCNFDATSIFLPRWNTALVERAAKEAGTSCFKWDFGRAGKFVFEPISRAQGNDRSRNAEAVTAYMKSLGYETFDYCQMD